MEDKYDIYICANKDAFDEKGHPIINDDGEPVKSKEHALANDLYNYLKEKFPKLHIFFSGSRLAIDEIIDNGYEKTISHVLSTIKLFILVGNSKESITYPWIKREWERYIKQIEKEETVNEQFLIYSEGIKQINIPKELRCHNFIESRNIAALNQLSTLISWIKF